jgi:hypothetical protein
MTKEETLAFLEENGGIDIECAKMQYEYMSDVYASVEDMIVDRIYGICRDKEVAKEVAKILIEESEV